MRTVLLATLSRRQGISFPLKSSRFEVIGTMILNPQAARHEMEISEEDFLKHSKELARLCAIPGLGWYVVEFLEKTDTVTIPDGVKDWKNGKDPFEASKKLSDSAQASIGDDLPAQYFALRKIATDLGIDTTNIRGNDALKAAIREARQLQLA